MSDTKVSGLRCEYLVDPFGIDELAPRLSWRIESERRGARQCAYRLRVSSSAEKLASKDADGWDSGWVESGQTTHVPYGGRSLRSREWCHWRVQVRDETGAEVQSTPAFWSMGLLEPSDWTATWISVDPEILRRDPQVNAPTLTEPGTPVLFRREFELKGALRRATVYASARGVFALRVNGRRVGEDCFAPEWTDYARRIHYRTYDVSSLLGPGQNLIAATLGDGWWSGFVGWHQTRARYGSLQNSLLVQLELEYEDGGRLVVGTDRRWQCSTGPILSADFQMGEVYDARRERPGWDLPGRFEDWLPACEVAPPEASLVAQRSEPVRVRESIAPVSARELGPGAWVFDLGQNISGWVKLELTNLPPGTRITVRHSERLDQTGGLYTENLRRAKATDLYIARGGVSEVFEPQFTFHGFQFFEIAADPPLSPQARVVATGKVVHSGLALAGQFECSDQDVNRLWLNGTWSQLDNFLSVPTDCPQRDERLGWMGDAQVFLRTASYNRDVAGFFTKWMVDVEDAQTADGIFPDVAPRIDETERFDGLDGYSGAAGWADAGIIVPWTIWRVYGDRRIIERHWGAMVAWLDYLERVNPRGIREHELGNNYGDWLCIPTDTSFRTHSPIKTLLATAYWADGAAKMARMARELGRISEAQRFASMFERVRTAFQREWLRDDGCLAVETQTAYLLALAFELLPEAVRPRAAERLVDNIRALDWHLSTGFIGISHLNPMLTLTGHVDVAYRLLLQDTFPSWLYPVKRGATTIWERWNGWTDEDGFFNPQMNSFNHYSLGSVGEWLFRHVAGIELDPEAPGFREFLLRPWIGTELHWVRASYATMHGTIASEWRRHGRRFDWRIRVPANTRATLWIPTVSGGPVETDGLALLRREPGFAVCSAAAGEYHLLSEVG